MDKKHEAMHNYILRCPYIRDLFYIYNNVADNSVSLIPVYSDDVVKWYIDGSAEKQYVFAIAVYKTVSDVPNTEENLEGLCGVQDFMDWIDEQNKNKAFPDFGERCTVESIKNLQDMPDIAGQDERHLKYMFQCRVNYIEAI